jgi:hypothetical protein
VRHGQVLAFQPNARFKPWVGLRSNGELPYAGWGQCGDVPQGLGEARLNGGVHGMDIGGTLRILRRRWYITGPLLLLTVATSAALAARPGPYQAESQVVLLPSAQSSKPAGGNPYLSFNDSETLTADLLRRQLTAPPLVQSLGNDGYGESYQVVDDPLTAGPVLDITVTGGSKASVEHTLAGVTNEAGTQLRLMQGRVAPIDQMTVKTVSYAPDPSLLVTRKARTPVVALAIGLLLSVAVPLTVDAAIAERREVGPSVRSRPSPARRAATTIAAAASWARMQQLKLARTGPEHSADADHGGLAARGQPVVADGDTEFGAKDDSAKVPDEPR